MYPQTHFLVPFLLGGILVKFGVFGRGMALVAGLTGVLIDIDHLLEHVIRKKKNKFSLRDAWNQGIHYHRFSERSFIHHWQGFLIVSLIFLLGAGFNWKIILALGLGYYSHLFLDYSHGKTRPKKILRLKEAGFFIQIPYYEIILDGVLVLGVIGVALV